MRNAYETYARLSAPKKTNRYATAGLVLGILGGFLGPVYSIIGLVRASKIGGVGRTRAVIGLTCSGLWAAAIVWAGVVAENSPTARNAVAARPDAGCVAIESKMPALAATVSSAKTPAAKAAAVQPIIDEVTADEAKTSRPAAKAAMAKFRKDLTQLQSDLRRSKADPALDTRIRTDGAAVDAACG